jgi:hypothetical protein
MRKLEIAMHPTNPLSWPHFALRPVAYPSGTPGAVRQALDMHGVPERSVGGEYVAMSDATFLDGHANNLLAFGRSGLTGRVCLEIRSLEIVHVPSVAAERVNPVNSSLSAFVACIEAAISRFPYYTYETADEFGEEAADFLRGRLLAIDSAVGAHNGLWETFFDDVAMGNYAEEEFERAVVLDGETSSNDDSET